MSLKDWIAERLTERLRPAVSSSTTNRTSTAAMRAGGKAAKLTSGSIRVGRLRGKSRVERHRMVNAALGEAFERGLHALAIKARGAGGVGAKSSQAGRNGSGQASWRHLDLGGRLFSVTDPVGPFKSGGPLQPGKSHPAVSLSGVLERGGCIGTMLAPS